MSEVIMFHHFADSEHPAGQGAIDAATLRRMLEWIGPERILPAAAWLRRHREGTLTGEICLTFDDNLRCQYDVAVPVLRDLGLTGIWFVSSSSLSGVAERLELYRYFRTVAFSDVDEFYSAFDAMIKASPHADVARRGLEGFVASEWLSEHAFYSDGDRRFRYLRDVVLGRDRYYELMDEMLEGWQTGGDDLVGRLWMDAACWQSLASEDHVLGLHSHTHPTDLASLPVDEQAWEYRTNKDEIARVTGQVATVAAHPASSYSEATLAILRDLGVDVAFTTVGPVRFDADLELPRVDHTDVMARAGL